MSFSFLFFTQAMFDLWGPGSSQCQIEGRRPSKDHSASSRFGVQRKDRQDVDRAGKMAASLSPHQFVCPPPIKDGYIDERLLTLQTALIYGKKRKKQFESVGNCRLCKSTFAKNPENVPFFFLGITF